MRLGGRSVRVLQWIAPVVLIAFLVFGRALVGAEPGWYSVIVLWTSPLILVALYLPPLLTLFDREAKASRGTRRGYAWGSWVLWGLLLLHALAVPDATDVGPTRSAITAWTGLSASVSGLLATIAAALALIAWIALLVLAVAGIRASRRRASAD